jgi:hypothetical protein
MDSRIRGNDSVVSRDDSLEMEEIIEAVAGLEWYK